MLDIGTELAKRYRVESWLGRSPLGNIYIAEDLEQGRQVAVKELRPDLAANPAFIWGLRHETEILNQNPQPGKLRPEEVVEGDRGAYVVVSYEPGMEMQELEERWPVSGYFMRSWDRAPASGPNEQAAEGPAASAGLPEAAIAGSLENKAPAARATGSATSGTGSTGHAPAPEPPVAGPEQAASAVSGPQGPGSEQLRPQRGKTSRVASRPLATGDRREDLSSRLAVWRRPSPGTIAVLLLTALVVGLAIAAFLRGPDTFAGNPDAQTAPGVLGLATATSTLSASATPPATDVPGLALLPAASASAASSPSPTHTPAVTPASVVPATPVLAITASPFPATVAPTQPPVPTPASAYVLIGAPANLRQGPGTNYTVLTVLQPGDQAAITGQSADQNWWQVRTSSGLSGWVFTSLVTVQGQVEQVPIVSAPSTVAPPHAPATSTPAIPPVAQPPTGTPTPGAPPPATLPPATASAVLGGCPTAPAGPFAALPSGRDQLGCPIGGLTATDFAHQGFESGQMLYRHDLRTIYVLYLDGTWDAFHDTYVEGEPFQAQQFNPPDGLKQPIKGFDRVWEQPAVRARLGWATRDEASVIQGQAQAFERGQATWFSRPDYLTAYFVLFADGTWAEYK